MDFTIPAEITSYLAELDAFIEKEIKPLERENDNIRFFDHRREWARTDFEGGGLPRHAGSHTVLPTCDRIILDNTTAGCRQSANLDVSCTKSMIKSP